MKRKRLLKEKDNFRKVQWILGIPYSVETYRAQRAEKAVADTLNYFKRKKTKFPGSRKIVEVNPIRHFSDKDLRGEDIEVRFDDGKVVPIQVKSWWIPLKKKKSYREKGICLITVYLELKNKTSKKIKKDTQERVYRSLHNYLAINVH